MCSTWCIRTLPNEAGERKRRKNEQNADNSFLKRCQTLRTVNYRIFFTFLTVDADTYILYTIGNRVFGENNKKK